jgi:hypothetical protein
MTLRLRTKQIQVMENWFFGIGPPRPQRPPWLVYPRIASSIVATWISTVSSTRRA